MSDFSRNGFGQVEPNHLSGQWTGQIYAQSKAPSSVKQLENGQFVYSNNIADTDISITGGAGYPEIPFMVFNEVKLYGETYNETYKDYAMQAKNFDGGVIVPRLIQVNIGDSFTTNTLVKAGSYREKTEIEATIEVGTTLAINANGFLDVVENKGNSPMEFAVIKVYNMADGQIAVKVQRVK